MENWMLVRLISITGLPANDPRQPIKIRVKGCQLHAGSLGVCQGQGIDEAEPWNTCPNLQSAQDCTLFWMTKPTEQNNWTDESSSDRCRKVVVRSGCQYESDFSQNGVRCCDL